MGMELVVEPAVVVADSIDVAAGREGLDCSIVQVEVDAIDMAA
jgi:hypothetical protein